MTKKSSLLVCLTSVLRSVAQVLGEAIDEATLRDILMECLEDNQQDKKVKEGTELQHRPATADDVSIIAHYIIKRFARGEKQLKKGEQAAGEEVGVQGTEA